MIQPLGFLDVSMFTARFLLKYREKSEGGILLLRDVNDAGEVDNLPLLKEWNSGRAMLSKLRAGAAPHFGGRTPDLGKAWIETLPPMSATPWEAESGEYADQHVRTRTCLTPAPGAMSHCGPTFGNLAVGMVHLMDHRQLCCEANHGEHARVHLVVDVKIPDAADTDG